MIRSGFRISPAIALLIVGTALCAVPALVGGIHAPVASAASYAGLRIDSGNGTGNATSSPSATASITVIVVGVVLFVGGILVGYFFRHPTVLLIAGSIAAAGLWILVATWLLFPLV